MGTSKDLELYFEHGIVHLICEGIEDIGLKSNFRLFLIWLIASASPDRLFAWQFKIASGNVGMRYFQGLGVRTPKSVTDHCSPMPCLKGNNSALIFKHHSW